MREIKFRIWSDKKMDYSPVTYTEWLNDNFEFDGYNEGEEPVVMQFTGLKDKNGKEIYEGDIVKRWINSRGLIYPSMYKKNIITIEFKNSSWNIKPKLLDRLEIIGNIYENKELLK